MMLSCLGCHGITAHPARLCCRCIGRLPLSLQTDLDRAVASGTDASPLWPRVLPIAHGHAREAVKREEANQDRRRRRHAAVVRRTIKAPRITP